MSLAERRQGFPQLLGSPARRRRRIVELMRHASSKRAEGRQLFRLIEDALRLALLGYVGSETKDQPRAEVAAVLKDELLVAEPRLDRDDVGGGKHPLPDALVEARTDVQPAAPDEGLPEHLVGGGIGEK